MKRYRILAIVASLLFILATAFSSAWIHIQSASAADGNLVVNPGFETGNLNNWTCQAGDTVTSSPAHSGSYALKIVPSGSTNGQCTQSISVQPNTKYTLSAYVNGPYVYLGATGFSSNWTNSTSYTLLTVSFTTSASTNTVSIYINGWYGQSSVMVDDVSLVGPGGTTTPTPTQTSTQTATATTTTTQTATATQTQTVTPTPTGTVQPGSKQVVGYFAQWGIYDRNYLVKNLVTSGAINTLTTLNYAFGNVSTGYKCYIENRLGWGDAWADFQKGFDASQSVDGVADTWDQVLKGNFNQLKKLKAKYPKLKVMISLGGWTWSGRFSDAALPANRVAFVQSCIDLYIKGNLPSMDGQGGAGTAAGIFDGIDIDWEYPAMPAFEGDPNTGNPANVYRPEDTQNYTALLAEFRKQLDAVGQQTGKHYLLTTAMPSGIDKIEKIQLSQSAQYLDWMNIMTYDMHGGWDATGPTNFPAPLYSSPNDPSPYPASKYNVDFAINTYLAAVPANKIVVGVPLYGRGWTNVPNVNNGLYQTSTSMQAAPGTYEAGVEDYKKLKLLNYPSFRDPITHAFWIFNGSTFWSYDDPTALAEKVNYMKSKGLLGVMAWEMDSDDASGTLMNAIHNAL